MMKTYYINMNLKWALFIYLKFLHHYWRQFSHSFFAGEREELYSHGIEKHLLQFYLFIEVISAKHFTQFLLPAARTCHAYV